MAVPPIFPALLAVARGATSFNTLGEKPLLRIHPATGIARLGDSPAGFFIGPEQPFAPPTGQDAGVGSAVTSTFRDGAGLVMRQAQRFRIFFNRSPDDAPVELNLSSPEIKTIEWTVHLANRKAAFFEFLGQLGADNPNGPHTSTAPKGRPKRRNASIPVGPARDKQLVIDPGPRSIKGALAGPIKFDAASGGNFPKDAAGVPVISELGELRTDNLGRLLVLGGRGKSASSNALPASAVQMATLAQSGFRGATSGAGRPPAPPIEYANNDTWFDDVSDGPVTAKLTLTSGKIVTVGFPAWVLVGPPDFAPGIRNVISLYDTMLDVAVRDLPVPPRPFGTTLDLKENDLKEMKASFTGASSTFQPEYFVDIEPTLKAGFQAKFVHAPVSGARHKDLDDTLPALQDPSPASLSIREQVFNMLRPPAGNTTYIGTGSMPKLFGDKYFDANDPRRVAAVTRFQFHLLKLWKDGKFTLSSGPGPLLLSPGNLDRAALESCVGGAFFPGIECSWLVRDKRLYLEPFRINHSAVLGKGPEALKVQPGFFSQQMAMPWQADFLDCRRDDTTLGGLPFGWWPAQRPDDVFLNVADAESATNMQDWARGVPPPPGGLPLPAQAQSHANMVARWNKLGFVVEATAPSGKKVFIERDRTLP